MRVERNVNKLPEYRYTRKVRSGIRCNSLRTRSVISGLLNSLVSSVSTGMKLEPRCANPVDVIKSLLNRP